MNEEEEESEAEARECVRERESWWFGR